MKKLQILLLVLLTILIARRAQSQDPCDAKSRNTVSISYEYVPNLPVGIDIRIGSVAQSGNLSGIIGFGLHGGNRYVETSKEGVYANKFVKQLSASAMLSWKIYHQYEVISLHLAASGHYYEQDGAYFKGGLRIDIPSGYKALYIYPSLTNRLQPSLELGVFLDL